MDIAHIINTVINARRLRRLTSDLLRDAELSYGELETLYILHRNDHIQPTRIATITHSKSSSLSRVLHKLSAKNLVHLETNHVDRRNVIVNITPEGLNLLDSLIEGVLEI